MSDLFSSQTGSRLFDDLVLRSLCLRDLRQKYRSVEVREKNDGSDSITAKIASFDKTPGGEKRINEQNERGIEPLKILFACWC